MHMIRTRNWWLICNSYLSTRTDIKSAAQIWSCFLHNPRSTRFIVAFAKRYAALHQLLNSLPFQIGNVWFLFLGRQADISNVIFCWRGCTNISLTLLQVTTFIIVQRWSLRFLVRAWYICLINLDFVTDSVRSLSTAWTFLEKGCQWKLRQTTLPCLLPCFYRWPWCSKSTSIGAIICTRDTEVYILRIKHKIRTNFDKLIISSHVFTWKSTWSCTSLKLFTWLPSRYHWDCQIVFQKVLKNKLKHLQEK